MTPRGEKLTFTIGVVALAAVIAGGVLTAEPAAAAKKPADPNAFVITATLKETTWSMSGSFSATGAIEDSGPASAPSVVPPPELTLHGQLGDIYIDLVDPNWGSFTITGGTDAYANLSGSGTYTFDVRRKKDGSATWKYTLEGSVHP